MWLKKALPRYDPAGKMKRALHWFAPQKIQALPATALAGSPGIYRKDYQPAAPESRCALFSLREVPGCVGGD